MPYTDGAEPAVFADSGGDHLSGGLPAHPATTPVPAPFCEAARGPLQVGPYRGFDPGWQRGASL